MKTILSLTASLFLLMSFSIIKLSDDEILAALKQANSTEIAKYFDDYVDVKLPNKDEAKNVSKNQASITLRDFFSEQNISGFDLASQRQIDGTGYVAGKFKSSSRDYNVTIMTKTKGSESVIVSIRIN